MRHAAVLLLLASCVLTDPPPPSEEYDDPPGTTDDPPETTDKRVFVTRGAYTGALTTVMGLDDGLAAGDAICQQRAKAAGLTGKWVAWLSSSTTDAIDRVTSQGPWRVIGGPVVFENRSQLYGEPLAQLDRDERGEPVPTSASLAAEVWTGTRAGGSAAPGTCNNWTSVQGTGNFGHKATTFAWTDAGFLYCDRAFHLICFEN